MKLLQTLTAIILIIAFSSCSFLKTQSSESNKNVAIEYPLPAQTSEEPVVLNNQTQKEKIRPIVILDPGHGGKDQGAHGLNNLIEKDYVLKMAQAVKEQLLKQGIDVVLTRLDDSFVSLDDRTKIANSNKAKLFVSLHGNASSGKKKNAHGFLVYYLDNTDDSASLKLAQRENQVFNQEKNEVDTLSFIISDLIQTKKIQDSIILSELINRAMKENFTKRFSSAKFGKIEKAPFYVLTETHIPSVLLELFFIDSKIDAGIIAQGNYFEVASSGIAEGIARYIKRNI